MWVTDKIPQYTCDAPKSPDRFPRSADGSFKSSEGFPTPVTSPLRPPKPPRTEIRQYSWRNFTNKEVCMHIRTLKPFKSRMEKKEFKFKSQGTTNCRNHSDVIVSSVIATSSIGDVTIRDIVDVNRPVARKRYAARKQLLVHSKEILKSSLSACNRTFTQMALLLVMIICILGGWFNIKLPERKSSIGTSSSLPLFEPLATIRFLDYWALSSLREYTDANIDINEGLWSRIPKVISLNNNEQLIRCMKILQNTIIYDETICTNRSLSSRTKLAAPYVYHDYATYEMATFTRNVSAGNHFYPYIFPSTDLCASHIDYFDTDTVNLESDYHFTAFYNLRYIYMYIYIYFLSFVVIL